MFNQKALVQAFFEAAFNDGVFPSTSNFVFHLDTDKHFSAPEATQLVGRLKTIYRDFSFRIDDMVEEGQKIAVRGITSGTDANSDRSFSIAGYSFVRLQDNQVEEVWFMDDDVTMKEQLGK